MGLMQIEEHAIKSTFTKSEYEKACDMLKSLEGFTVSQAKSILNYCQIAVMSKAKIKINDFVPETSLGKITDAKKCSCPN